jgi:Ribonuclease G/E
MTKELFVTSTPHETKVGLVEDDQLAEIYLERENEYTLAGSIYKGRVTRVLPGMQSAFVDIGLERDAFLYVSDFMELEEHDEDLTDVVPTNRPPLQESRPPQPRVEATAAPTEGASYVIESEPFTEEGTSDVAAAPAAIEPENGESQPRERGGADRGGWRGRRRRRGRRGERDERYERNDRGPAESRFARSAAADASSSSSAPSRSRTPDYGPPPG